MKITRQTLRAMILKEMADILPFRGPVRRGGQMGGEMGGQEGEAEIFDFPVADPESDRMALLKETLEALRSALIEFKNSMVAATQLPVLGRVDSPGQGAPALRAARQAVATVEALVGMVDTIADCADEFGSEICETAVDLISDLKTHLDLTGAAAPRVFVLQVARAPGLLETVQELLSRLGDGESEDEAEFDPVEAVRKALITVRLAERNRPEDFADAFGNMIMMTEEDLLEALEGGATDPAIKQILDVYDQGKDALSKDEFSVTTGEEIYKLQATVDIGALVEELEEILDIT
jgi:hypothetical protein